MKLSSLARCVSAACIATLYASLLASCSGTGTGVRPPVAQITQPGPSSGGQSTTFSLSPKGATLQLPLPSGFSGAMTIGPNSAPEGAKLRVGSFVSGAATGVAPLSTTHTDPFPVLFSFFNFLPFPITLPVNSFSLCLPAWVSPGVIDVSLLNNNLAVGATNPSQLTQATIIPPAPNPRRGCRGAVLNVPSFTLTLLPQTPYTLELFRDVSGAYPGGASTAVLPVQPGVSQPLPPTGTLGATVNINLASGSGSNGFLIWQNINGSPSGVPPFIYNDGPQQSIVVTSTQPVVLDGANISSNTTGSGALFTTRPAHANQSILQPFATTSTPPPGTFVPDGKIVLGPFPATVSGNQVSFAASGLSGQTLGPNTGWGFFVVTVTVCVPNSTALPCDGSEIGNPNNPNPSQSNAVTSLTAPGSHFPFQRDVFVSDASNRLTGSYSLSVANPGGGAAPCVVPSNPPDDNGDVPLSPPWPFYNDAANNSGANNGPNAEFEVSFTGVGDCTIVASYNGTQVASATVTVASSPLAAQRRQGRLRVHPFTLRPPVNGPRGYASTGTTVP